MDNNTVTLVIGLAGILATLISSLLGLYFTSKARTRPLRELLYAKQIDLISRIIHKQSRFKIYATILTGDDSDFKEAAREDIRVCTKDYSELTEESTAMLPTELWIEIHKLSRIMVDILITYDDTGLIDNEKLTEYSVVDLKIALVSRTIVGTDELTNENIKLFSSDKDFEKLAKIKPSEFGKFIKKG